RPDLSGVALDQDLPVHLAREDLRADLGDAAGTERVGLAWKAERRGALLALLQEGRGRPLRLEGALAESPVDGARQRPERLRHSLDPGVNCLSHLLQRILAEIRKPGPDCPKGRRRETRRIARSRTPRDRASDPWSTGLPSPRP